MVFENFFLEKDVQFYLNFLVPIKTGRIVTSLKIDKIFEIQMSSKWCQRVVRVLGTKTPIAIVLCMRWRVGVLSYPVTDEWEIFAEACGVWGGSKPPN